MCAVSSDRRMIGALKRFIIVVSLFFWHQFSEFFSFCQSVCLGNVNDGGLSNYLLFSFHQNKYYNPYTHINLTTVYERHVQFNSYVVNVTLVNSSI